MNHKYKDGYTSRHVDIELVDSVSKKFIHKQATLDEKKLKLPYLITLMNAYAQEKQL